MYLKDKLFPDSNITGKTDSKNQPIMVGHQLKDEAGNVWYVHQEDNRYVVADEPTLDNPNTLRIPLNLFLLEWHQIEIVK